MPEEVANPGFLIHPLTIELALALPNLVRLATSSIYLEDLC